MPPLELMDRHTTAVLWPLAGYDREGQPYVTQTGRTEIQVRWNRQRRQVTDAENNTVVIDGTVIGDRDVAVGSVLWEGAEEDIPGTAYEPTSNLFLIYSSNKFNDIKGRNIRYEWMVVRHSNTLPLGAE